MKAASSESESESESESKCRLLGAIPRPGGGIDFTVWAPAPREIALVCKSPQGAEAVVELQRAKTGYAHAYVPSAGPGTRYGYRINGNGPFPDPCSRSQPDGVDGLSEVITPSDFAWTDAGWRRPPFADAVLYECHVGTFTPEGTFDSARAELARLKRIGVTIIELMPIASFPGRWNWGYDCVAMFAPSAVYGGPEGLRRFVDAAHHAGIAVVLDVVFNHFGPTGNYTSLYSDSYLTAGHHTPWGAAVNYDRPGNDGVRTFVIQNLRHWVEEYHVDGFRFDATHAICDASTPHILAEVSSSLGLASSAHGRPYLMAETHENDRRYLDPVEQGGFGFDAVWADDFHHSVRAVLTGEHEGWFAGFSGKAADVARTVRNGFLYEGQFDPGAGRPRGRRARGAPWPAFIYCLQNHDQVGNRPFGDRIDAAVARADLLAASMLLLLLPQTPLVFQGQEYGEASPFQYFTDHDAELGALVTEGRRAEFARFAGFADPVLRERIPDPQSPGTLERSRLGPERGEAGLGSLTADFFQAALGVRRNDPVLRAYRRERLKLTTAVSGKALIVNFVAAGERRTIAVNWSDTRRIALPHAAGRKVLLSTTEPRFGGNGRTPVLGTLWASLPAHSAVLFAG